MRELYLVLCTASATEGGRGLEVASRRFFFTLKAAQDYRATISSSRSPLIAKVVEPPEFDRPLCAVCGALLAHDGLCSRQFGCPGWRSEET